MAVEYKIRGDASQLKKELQGVTAKEARLEQQTIKTKQSFERLNTSALRNENSLRRAKLATEKITAAELKFAASTKVATAGMKTQRRVTIGLAAAVGALRNQILLVTFATAALVAGVKKLSNENQALEESVNAVRVVFQSSAASILLFGTTTSQQLGIARSEFNQLSTVLGALLKQTEIPLTRVADLTLQLTQRATDLASVFDTPVKDALNAINSALRGQTEPITRYAADVTIAALENFALSEGILESVAAMTQQEKRLLRVRLILKQTNDVQGDFQKTQETTANLTRRTVSAWKDMTAQLGKRLDPAVNTTIGFFNRLFTSIEKTVGGTNLLAESSRLLREEFGKLSQSDTLGLLLTQFVQLNKDIKTFKDDIAEAARITQEEFLAGIKEIVKEQKTLVANEKLIAFFRNLNFDTTLAEFKLITGLGAARLNLEEKSNSLITRKLEFVKEVTEAEKRAHVANLNFEDEQNQALSNSVRLAQRFTNTLAQAALHGASLKQTFLSIAASFLSFGISEFFERAKFGGISTFAHGTSFAPGGPAVVGERGPELVNLPRGAQVTPSNRTTNNVSFGNINITNTGGSLDAEEVSRAFNAAVDLGLPIRRSGV